jgi:putative Mn2+ efflux pump MntP
LLIDPFNNRVLFMLSVATSVDALAIGVGFAFLELPLLISVRVIGLVTFFLSLAGIRMGYRFGRMFDD